MDKEGVLKHYFGHTHFRRGQAQLVDGILAGRDVLGIMPTGGGKSLCYQVPALLLEGLTLVISPLISLMKDQVMALGNAGIPAAFINSSLSEAQLRTVYSRTRAGAYKIVYVAPERLEGEGFTALMRELRPALIAVDEAHCISQWGQDFRPSYLKITEFIQALTPRPVVAAFTATATALVQEDIVRILQLETALEVVTGFDRPNLFFDVRHPKNKAAALASLLDARRERSGIVYCATRNKVEEVCQALLAMDIPATRYHAGLSVEERQQNQDDFQYDRKSVMVATNAFGMGIDKSNVSFVIHYNMPKNLEAYYQEAGRAGRDGERAECILLFAPGDVNTASFMIQNSSDNEELGPEERQRILREDHRRLEDMTTYCKTTDCLRGYILGYFGQEHGDRCGNCGSCTEEHSLTDITVEAQMILSCVKRVQDFLGYSLGSTMLVNILAGSKEKRLLTLGLERLPTYGLMRQSSRTQIRDYIDFLAAAGYLHKNPDYGSLALTARATQVLFGGAKVEMLRRQHAPELQRTKTRQTASVEESSPLLERLKTLRYHIAKEENVPAYIVFSNATLSDMAARAPRSPDEFLEVSGVGERKAARYGKRFLAAIAAYEAE